MKNLPKIVIVGRPNVGKSSLFNRIIQKRLAITSETPQTTRDRIYGTCEWLTRKFILVDTGGISNEKIDFQTEINQQVKVALDEADVVILVCSYQSGLLQSDEEIARLLYKTKKPVILVANKYDQNQNQTDTYDFMTLGFDLPILVSAAHGIGIGDLLDRIITFLSNIKVEQPEKPISIGIIGRPNVGKSSLVNALLNEKRVIVSPISGTTTDAIDSYFQYNQQRYCLIDTAGIRRKGKITESVEKYSVIRTYDAIKRSDIIIFLIDGFEGIIEQDLTVAGIAKDLTKPVIIVINKWDLIKEGSKTFADFEKQIKEKFKYLDYSLITFISALNQNRISQLLQIVTKVLVKMKTRVKTSILNEILSKAQLINQAPHFNGGRLKIFYATQVETEPPTFILMVNNKKYCHFSYERFLINQIRQSFDFTGVPIKLIFRTRKSIYHE